MLKHKTTFSITTKPEIIEKSNRFVQKLLKRKGTGDAYTLKLLALFGLQQKSKINYANRALVKSKKVLKKQKKQYAKDQMNQNNNLRFLVDNKYYKGTRHLVGLPVHGQRTHTNAKTSRKFKNKR